MKIEEIHYGDENKHRNRPASPEVEKISFYNKESN